MSIVHVSCAAPRRIHPGAITLAVSTAGPPRTWSGSSSTAWGQFGGWARVERLAVAAILDAEIDHHGLTARGGGDDAAEHRLGRIEVEVIEVGVRTDHDDAVDHRDGQQGNTGVRLSGTAARGTSLGRTQRCRSSGNRTVTFRAPEPRRSRPPDRVRPRQSPSSRCKNVVIPRDHVNLRGSEDARRDLHHRAHARDRAPGAPSLSGRRCRCDDRVLRRPDLGVLRRAARRRGRLAPIRHVPRALVPRADTDRGRSNSARPASTSASPAPGTRPAGSLPRSPGH